MLFQLHTYTHAKSANISLTICVLSLKYIMLFPFVALTAKGHWELTDVRESEVIISMDYVKRFSQTFPDKVS